MPGPDSSREGLSWACDLDLGQLLEVVGATQLGAADDEQAAADEAAAGGTAADRTGAVLDQLPPGPALAAWIAGTDVRSLSEWDLPGVASAYHRLAAWAQARELQAVAEQASRTATRDDHVGVGADGRPDQVTPAAASTIGLELVLSHPAAMDWTSLGVTLRWKLPATWAALDAGTLDLYRARLIADATDPLDDDTARAVESRILPAAGDQTSGQLRAALRRAVIAADPEGAEQRRKEAQRHAKVSLYPDPADGTATLAGSRLPGVHAAAAMARLTAIARAMKSAGMTGGLDYLRANAFIGLLLDTLPLVPPPDGDPGPGAPTDPDPDAGSPDSGDPSPGGPGSGGPGPDDSSIGDPGPGDSDAAEPGPDDSDGDEPGPSDAVGDRRYGDDEDWNEGPSAAEPRAAWPPIPPTLTQTAPFVGRPPPRQPSPATHPSPGHPPPRDHPPPTPRPPSRAHPRPARHRPPRGQLGRPSPGLLELVISWRALTGDPAGHATINRVGPITAAQARPLALTAAADPHARWQVIVTDPDGYAIAVETVRRGYRPGQGRRPAGVTSQVAVTIPAATLDQLTDNGHGIKAAVLRAARRARAHAQQQATADASAPSGCAHTDATPSYRPTQKIRDYVTARDQTCRNPRCRQPARHADLDHTIPWDRGGPTCRCNLGGHCRTHHKIKQLPGWTLTQPKPGHFQLTTPAGRSYTTTPDPHPD
ncbi:MAG TPA: DUF222 domain-containing protein [Streptosporangiaceae bacterium]|nr:DUF222 domain-containing protein [Streptosporangiaceae bacterium]